MAEEDEQIIVGAPSRNYPPILIALYYVPGSRTFQATICDHEVVLAPASQQAFATGDYGLICSDCVEAYSILRGGAQEHLTMPGAVEELESHLGVEEAQRVIEESTPELERRIGIPMKKNEEK